MIQRLKDWWTRRREAAEAERQTRAYMRMLLAWYQKNWWRIEPPEGWRPGHNIGTYPLAMLLHQQANDGKIIPPTVGELHRVTGVPLKFIQDLNAGRTNHFRRRVI